MEYLSAHDISYIHPDKEILFKNLNLSLHEGQKVAMIGRNGSGKSIFLKILSGIIKQTSGKIKSSSVPYYLPQHFGQYNGFTIAKALHIDHKLNAIRKIIQGNMGSDLLAILNEDWKIEERGMEALYHWDIGHLSFQNYMDSLSGGEKTRVFLAGISIHMPEIILLDEPTNHLDNFSRNILYNFIESSQKTIVVVSHDRILLDMLSPMYELNKNSINMYGGNYSFYTFQKKNELMALKHKLVEKQKSLRAARKTAQKAFERKNRADARGVKKHKGKVPTVLMNQLKNKAQKSASKLKGTHTVKMDAISEEISKLQKELPQVDKMKMDFENTSVHIGKTLVNVQDINFGYTGHNIWSKAFSFQIKSGERIHIAGKNGTGKTTLIKLILGTLAPSEGRIIRSEFKSVYIDQEYSLINDNLTIYEQAERYNNESLQEHEIKIRLYRYLFKRETWTNLCRTLSGGEKMKLALCCLMINNKTPDIFALDEPTNNLDIQNIDILTSAIKTYRGTIIVVSHDSKFLKDIGVNRKIEIVKRKVKGFEVYKQ